MVTYTQISELTINWTSFVPSQSITNWTTYGISLLACDNGGPGTGTGTGTIYAVCAQIYQYGDLIVQDIVQLIPTPTKNTYDGYLFTRATVDSFSHISAIIVAYGYVFFSVALRYNQIGKQVSSTSNNYIAQYSVVSPTNSSSNNNLTGLYKSLSYPGSYSMGTNVYGLAAYNLPSGSTLASQTALLFISMYNDNTNENSSILAIGLQSSGDIDYSLGVYVNFQDILIKNTSTAPLNQATYNVASQYPLNTYSQVNGCMQMAIYTDTTNYYEVLYVVTTTNIQLVYLPGYNCLLLWGYYNVIGASPPLEGWPPSSTEYYASSNLIDNTGEGYPLYQQAAGSFLSYEKGHTGNFLSTITCNYGSNGQPFGNQITLDSDGNIYIAGGTGNVDYYIMEFNATYNNTFYWTLNGGIEFGNTKNGNPVTSLSLTTQTNINVPALDYDFMAIAYNSATNTILYAGSFLIGQLPYPFIGGGSFGEVNTNTNTNNLVSNICFVANTPIKTNQGNIEIAKINPKIHTIDGKKIIAITKTTSLDNFLVCIEKDALGENIPSQKTIISKDHFILYEGKAIKAKKLLGLNEKIYKIKYNGEILFNVLMEDYNKMSVNNLICETLHPKNLVAQIYKQFPELKLEEQERLIKKVNETIKKEEMKRKNIEKKQNHLKLAIL